MTATLPTLKVPQLSGGRRRARALVEQLGGRLPGAAVVVDFRSMVAGTPSFADELVLLVLDEGKAAVLRAEHVSQEFGAHLRDAARDHGAAERLQIT